jgi:predicted MFS family arabinose efflux permease
MWDLFLETFSSVGSLTSKISLIDIFFFLFIGLFNITRINQLFRWGRRISFLLMIYMAVTLSIATAFSPNYTVYMIFRAINGLTFPALFQIPYILGKFIIFNLTNKMMATINLDCKNTLNILKMQKII